MFWWLLITLSKVGLFVLMSKNAVITASTKDMAIIQAKYISPHKVLEG
ncbi:hypothetical protein [Pseudogracilibacillus sp. SO30301A]